METVGPRLATATVSCIVFTNVVMGPLTAPVLKPSEVAEEAKNISRAVDVYTGGWQRDQHAGLGRLTLHEGEAYEGEWSAGRRDGRGMCYYPDGTCYVGERAGALPHADKPQ